MPVPRLFFGGTDGLVLNAQGASYMDNGVMYDVLAQTNKSAPAGPGGECIFTNLYLTTRRFVTPVRVLVTPIVDGVAMTVRQLDLTGAPAVDGTVEVSEISLMEAFISGGLERMRTALRGSAIEFAFATSAAAVALGGLEISVAEVEYEIVRETKPVKA